MAYSGNHPALSAYSVLCAGACLQTHAPSFTLTPAHLASLSAAASDLISCYLGRCSPTLTTAAGGPPLPLSPGPPLSRYLASLPSPGSPCTLPTPASASASAGASAKDSSLSQVVRDAERDSYSVNGCLVQGSTAKFAGLLSACAAAAGSAAAAAGLPPLPPSCPGLLEALTSCLRQASRTRSGGDAYEAAMHHLGLASAPSPLPLLLTADSAGRAVPVGVALAAALLPHPQAPPVPPSLAASLAALLQAHPQLTASAEALGPACAWAASLQPVLVVDICATTLYQLVLDSGAAEGGGGRAAAAAAAAAAEPRVVAKLRAVFRHTLHCFLAGAGAEGATATTTSLPLPFGQPTISLCREEA